MIFTLKALLILGVHLHFALTPMDVLHERAAGNVCIGPQHTACYSPSEANHLNHLNHINHAGR